MQPMTTKVYINPCNACGNFIFEFFCKHRGSGQNPQPLFSFADKIPSGSLSERLLTDLALKALAPAEKFFAFKDSNH